MPAYDASLFDPPAPIARVILRNPATGVVWSDVPMLLDSGADLADNQVQCRISLVDILNLFGADGWEVIGPDTASRQPSYLLRRPTS